MAAGKSGKRAKKTSNLHTPTAPNKTKTKFSSGKSDAFHRNQDKPAAGPNPYDVFQNKHRKNAVLGERRAGEKRNLAKTRATAVTGRATELLKDCLIDRRASKFRDARLGGDNSQVDRLVKVRQKQSKRSFALGAKGQEALTVGGRSLADMADSDLRQGGEEEDGDEGWDPDDPVGKGKIRKAQEQQERKEHDDMLGKLDADFGDISAELEFRPPKAQALKSTEKKPAPDEYDKLMREMVYERKATATERTKTPEEVARAKAEELADLERERSARAMGGKNSVGTFTTVADDDDKQDAIDENESEFSGEEGEGEESEEEDDAEAGDDVEGGGEKDESGAEKKQPEDDAMPEVDAGEVDDDDRLGEDCIPLFSAKQVGAVNTMVNDKDEEGLPYSLACPKTRRGISTLLEGRGPQTAVKLVHRVRTCTAVSLAAGNRDKLRTFFIALLDYASNVAVRDDGDLSAKGLQVLYALRPQLVELAREHPDEAHSYFAEKLRVLSPATLPQVAEVCCLKLIAFIFPTSDFQHPVTSPAAILADHWATRIATLGTEIADLISEAVFLWGALYDLTAPSGRFSASFFRLGTTILDSCWASAGKGREQITESSADVLAVLLKVLHSFGETAPASGRAVANHLLRPAVEKATARGIPAGKASEQLKSLKAALDEVDKLGMAPLSLFEAPPAQIKTLEPVFHEQGDTSARKRGMDLTETQLLKKQLNEERRAANRQLRRDSATLQTLHAQKDSARRVARTNERQRVWKLMDTEKQEIKQMMTENGGGMDTSLGSYSKTKERKKENKRMGGNATAATEKPGATAGTEKTAKGAEAEKSRKTPSGSKKKKRKN